eukprot:CAMPEP_0174838844 /NCGR_PEP_ID=MMETSP1114-20130205/7664_1 /TAXON_ID=312471 /ORGANISM="Neobodo designis, Strain CCAP 1951/1" /LENGTH=227 /DNA_ID=CAMNT_0016072955 /DNA_START=37 /DNA_END=720 /DNA_ORIENTATION=+
MLDDHAVTTTCSLDPPRSVPAAAENTTGHPSTPDPLASGVADVDESPNLVELADADDLAVSHHRASAAPTTGGPSWPRGHGPPCIANDARASLSVSGLDARGAPPGPFQARFSRSENYRPAASWSASVVEPSPLAGVRPAAADPHTAARGDLPARPSAAATLLPPPAPLAAKVGHTPPLAASLDDSEFHLAAEEFEVEVGASRPLLPPPMHPFTRTSPVADSDDDTI